MCGAIPTVDVRDERYEVNHCSEEDELPNQVERRGVGWSDREYQRQQIDQEDKGKKKVQQRQLQNRYIIASHTTEEIGLLTGGRAITTPFVAREEYLPESGSKLQNKI